MCGECGEKNMHGGDIYRNNIAIDFSVNVNPFGVSERIRQSMIRSMPEVYPDLRCEGLREAIASCIGVQAEEILCGNGASELFPAILHALRPGQAVIPTPSFGGYERAARAADARIFYVPFCADAAGKETGIRNAASVDADFAARVSASGDVLFLANPNNPTGTLLREERLREILDACHRWGMYVVLDECFAEFAEEMFCAAAWVREYPRLIVVRAFTKSFAIPGLRLGYLVCADGELRERIRLQLPEWNVSIVAQHAGIVACAEYDGLREMAAYVARERAWLVEELGRIRSAPHPVLQDLIVFPSAVNFLLLYTRFPLYEALLRKKILIRDCSDFVGLGTGFYRIAVKRHEENSILCRALWMLADQKTEEVHGTAKA